MTTNPDTTVLSNSAPTPASASSAGTLSVILTGTFIVTLDFFIVNVAVPSIQRDLHASDAVVQWVVAAYGLAYAAMLICAGRLGDMAGRRRIFIVGMAGFVLASALCGLASTAGAMILGRAAQGLAAAMISPQVLAMLGTLFEGRARSRAFSAYGLTLGLAAVGGQLIGGLLIGADIAGLGWRSCFLINLPVGLLSLALAPWLIPRTPRQPGQGMDYAGTLLIALAMTALMVPLIEGRQRGWPLWSIAGLLLSAVLVASVWQHQRHRAARSRPVLLHPALFAERRFVLGLATVLAYYLSNAALFLVLALYLQDGHGQTPMQSGLLFSVLGADFFITTLAAPRLPAWLSRHTLALGGLTMTLALAGMGLTSHIIGEEGQIMLILPWLLLDGLGMGLLMAPLASAVLASAPAQQAGSAAGLLATLQQLGNALGVALIGLIFYAAPQAGASPPAAAIAGFEAGLVYLALLTSTVTLLARGMRA